MSAATSRAMSVSSIESSAPSTPNGMGIEADNDTVAASWASDHVYKGRRSVRVVFLCGVGCAAEYEVLRRVHLPKLTSTASSEGLVLEPTIFNDLHHMARVSNNGSANPDLLLLMLRAIDACDVFVAIAGGAAYGWHDVMLSNTDTDTSTGTTTTTTTTTSKGDGDTLLKNMFAVAAREFPWVGGYRMRSLFEVAVLAAHFKRLGNKAVHLYFRDPTYDARLHTVLVNRGESGQARAYVAESEKAARWLSELRLCCMRTANFACHVETEVAGPAEAARAVYSHVKASIKKCGRACSSAVARGILRRWYWSAKADGYVDCASAVQALDARVRGTATAHAGETAGCGGLTCIAGAAGSGKGSLLAAWVAGPGAEAGVHVVAHAGRASGSAASLSVALRSLTIQLAELSGEPAPLMSVDVRVLSETFERYLALAAAAVTSGIVVVVIEALDALGPHALEALPRSLPRGAHFLVSCANAAPLEARGWTLVPAPTPTTEAERAAMIRSFASRCPDLAITPAIEAACLEALTPPAALTTAPALPGLVALALRVIPVVASAGTDDTKTASAVLSLVEEVLAAKTISSGYAIVIRHAESTTLAETPGYPSTLGRILGLLHVSALGLSAGELLAMCGLLKDTSSPSPPAAKASSPTPVAAVELALALARVAPVLDALTAGHNGLMACVDPAVRQAIVTYYGLAGDRLNDLRRAVIAHYAGIVANAKAMDEKAKEKKEKSKGTTSSSKKGKDGSSSSTKQRRHHHSNHQHLPFQIPPRAVAELPHQLTALGDTKGLTTLLQEDDDMFAAMALRVGAEGHAGMFEAWHAANISPTRMAERWVGQLSALVKCVRGDRSKLIAVATGYAVLGQHLASSGRFEQAVAPYGKALALTEKFEGLGSTRLWGILGALARLCSDIGQHTNAERFALRALEIGGSIHAAGTPGRAELQLALARIYLQSSKSDRAAELVDKAETLSRAALKAFTSHLSQSHPRLGEAHAMLCKAMHAAGKSEDALKHARAAATCFERALGTLNLRTAAAQHQLGSLALMQGNTHRARSVLEAALRTRSILLGPKHEAVAETLQALGMLAAVKGDIDTAVHAYKSALEILEALHGAQHELLLDTLEKLAELTTAPADAERLWQRCLDINTSLRGPESSSLCDPLYNMAQLALEQGELPRALRHLTRLATIALRAFGPDHALTREAIEKRDTLRTETRGK